MAGETRLCPEGPAVQGVLVPEDGDGAGTYKARARASQDGLRQGGKLQTAPAGDMGLWHGTLTEGKRTVRLTSSLRRLV